MDVKLFTMQFIQFNFHCHHHDILKYVPFKAEIMVTIVSNDKKDSTATSRLSSKTENTLF